MSRFPQKGWCRNALNPPVHRPTASTRRFPRHHKKGTNVAQTGTNGHPKDEWAQSGTNGRNRKRRRRGAAMNLILLKTKGGWHLFSPYFPAPPQKRWAKTGLREVLLRAATEPPPQPAGNHGRLAAMAMTRRAAVAASVHFLGRLSQRGQRQPGTVSGRAAVVPGVLVRR